MIGRTRINFQPLTGGGSYFTTDNEKLQNQLENHYDYGRLFKCNGVVEEPKPVEVKKEEAKAEAGKKQIVVACLDDAKEYLAENIGASRTKMRSEKAIKELAAQNNIEFVGI